ncbi:peritrophin-1-like [Bradysia coprophila]|uniref:peritrophin-1-like n=1 Tax=Bradysia coprophila TaxID=38358 RepID=UPI00187DBEC4|nr:peritrophin-1-like [Bradysia coprophila]
MFKYALLLASVLITTVHGNQPCLGVPQDRPRFAASPESCNAYIICMNGQAIPGGRCPEGLLFDAVNEMCSSSSCTDCSPFGIQNLPYPQSCSRFIQCSMGIRTFSACPSGYFFDRTIGFCNHAELVECDDPTITTTEPPTTDLPECFADGLFHPHPTSCSHFFICVNFDLWEQECAPGLHWNRSQEKCDSPEAAKCPIPSQ